jgi:hypothetical protein
MLSNSRKLKSPFGFKGDLGGFSYELTEKECLRVNLGSKIFLMK